MQIRGEVSKHLRHNPDAEILITGHSLGGALATLCFLDLQLTLGLVPFAPVYIYGAPRVRQLTNPQSEGAYLESACGPVSIFEVLFPNSWRSYVPSVRQPILVSFS